MVPTDPPADSRRTSTLTGDERRFVERSVRRARLFLGFAIAGVVIALGIASLETVRRWADPGHPVGLRAALVILILLNARQNLRQYRYARILAKLNGRTS